MTQFSALRQVFENFLDLQDLFINPFAALDCLLSKTSLVCSEALDYCTAFWTLASILKSLCNFHAIAPG
jgi:hypothetical protein